MAISLGNFTENELNTLIGAFKITQKNYTFKPLTDGFINDTFLVLDEGKPQYVLQRINNNVFNDVEGLMLNISTALSRLKANDYSQIKLILAISGKTYASVSSGYWRVMTYIKNSTAYNTTIEPYVAFEAGRIIAQFHILLKEEELGKYVDTIPKFHNLELRKMQFIAALARTTDAKKEVAAKAISFGHDTLKKIETFGFSQLPTRICHNDTKLNNILFSEKHKKALCLIDLDTIMKGYFHYDFGDAVRTIVNTAAEDEQDHSKITFNKTLFEAFISGLAHNGSFLDKNEITALPIGVILMPFLHGLRALTDYLNHNRYYKVTYENQNLDRCLSLFDFTQKALNQLKYMEDIIALNLSSN